MFSFVSKKHLFEKHIHAVYPYEKQEELQRLGFVHAAHSLSKWTKHKFLSLDFLLFLNRQQVFGCLPAQHEARFAINSQI